MEVIEEEIDSYITSSLTKNDSIETLEHEENIGSKILDGGKIKGAGLFFGNDSNGNISSQPQDNGEVKFLNSSISSTNPKDKRKRLIHIVYSDSDDELQTETNLSDKDNAHSEVLPDRDFDEGAAIQNHSATRIIDSDSDSEKEKSYQNKSVGNESRSRYKIIDSDSEYSENDTSDNKASKTNVHSKFNRIDTDSEVEEQVVTPHNKSSRNHDISNRDESEIYTTDSKGELVLEAHVKQKSKWSAICDDDSSGEENNDVDKTVSNMEEPYSDEEIIKPITYKKKRSKNEEKGPKKITPKEAAKLRKETISESHRMIRESNVSLPYHKPKSFTLKEFLSRRPKLTSAVPINVSTPPSVAIKLCAEKLAVISKKLEEREKEVKDFYKSESESENVEDPDYVPPQNGEVGEENGDQSKIEAVSNTEMDSHNMEVEEVRIEATNALNENAPTANSDVTETKSNEITVTDSIDEVDDKMDGNVRCEQSEIVIEEDISNTDNLERNTENVNKSSDTTTIKDTNSKDFYTLQEDNCEESNDQNKDLEQKGNQSSEAYEFNLDDLDDSGDQNIIVTSTEANQLENLGAMGSDTDKSEKPHKKNLSAKLKILQDIELNIQPRLSGGPTDVIDLAEGVTKPNEITMLMERFEKHTRRNPIHKNKVKLNVVSVTGGHIHNETVAINVDEDVETDPSSIEEKPGVKLARLRGSLQSKLAQRRSELWKQKLEKTSKPDNETDIYAGEKSECDADKGVDEILDDDNEEEMSASSEEDEEDEEFEEITVEKVKSKSPFVDGEAEDVDMEDDDEDLGGGDENDYNEPDDEDEDSDAKEPDCTSNDYVSKDDHKTEKSPTKKPLRRIIKGFSEDSDDEDSPLPTNVGSEKVLESQEDEITCHQPPRLASRTGSELEFLTPVSYITGIQNLNNSTSKVSPFRAPNVPSPLKDSNWHSDLQKKLFQNSEISNTQAQAISELCAEPFSDSQEIQDSGIVLASTSAKNSSDTSFEVPCTAPPTTQDLMDICSGGFTGTSQVVECTNQMENTITKERILETGKSSIENHCINPTKELKSLDEDHGLIISQLLNEEEMENFKKKFDSPVMTNTQKRIVEEFEEDIAAAGGVIDSDDEDENLEIKKKKKQKKLHFSDDESSDNEGEEEEEINLHDDVEAEEDDDVPADNIDYDSEENEVELNGDPKRKFKVADFVENEAELSESEWGSEDEDEKDLDNLEAELGDEEKFDEKKIRDDLEKIHMRRMLNDDDREVKLLQEMLLEDGELHGTGRERQFKWKNIDSADNTEGENAKEDDDVYFDEEESEEQWRRRRHEREMFLKEKLEKSQRYEDENLLGDSQLLKIGHEVLRRSQKGSSQGNEVKESPSESPKFKSTFTLSNKRGSFLSRGEEVLQRLSVYNKVTETVVLGTAKNSRNFLFQTVSAVEETLKIQDKKRKAADGTPAAIKKLRLSENLSPANRKKKEKPSAKSKLLFNLTD